MNNSLRTFRNYQSVAAFALIVVFMILGSCPVKKVLHSALLSDASAKKEHSAAAFRPVNVSCAYYGDPAMAQISQPERNSIPAPPAPAVFLVIVLLSSGLLPFIHSRNNPELQSADPRPVPVYLRNRILRI